MELDKASTGFQLVFEGPSDSSDETMRRIKGAFLIDLEMPAEQILSILNSTPATVKQSETPEELEKAYKLLKEAGSKVLIVSSEGVPWTPAETEKLEDLLSFELGGDFGAQAIDVTTPESSHTYTLNEDSGNDLENLLKEAAAGLDDDEAEPIVPDHEAGHTFSLRIDGLDVRSSPEELPGVSAASAVPSPTPDEPAPFNLSLSRDDDPPAPKAPPAPAAKPVEPPPIPGLNLSLDDGLEVEPILAALAPRAPAPAAPAAPPAVEALNLSLSLDDDEPAPAPKASAPAVPPVKAPSESMDFSLTLSDEEPEAPVVAAPPAKEPKPTPIAPSISLSLDAEEEHVAPPPPSAPATEPVQTAAAPAPGAEPTIKEPEPAKKQTALCQLTTRKPDATQPPVDPQAAPPDINLVSVRDLRRKKLTPQQEMVSYIMIGSVLLFLANWIYFNQPPPVEENDVAAAQDLALKVAQKKKLLIKKQLVAEEESKIMAEALKPRDYSATFKIEDYQFQLTLKISGAAPKEALFTVVSPPQPEATNEQIAKGEIPAPWIRRIDSAQFEFTANKDETFSGKGLTKVFIEYNGAPTRIVRQIQLEGGPARADGSVPVTVRVSEPDAPAVAEDFWKLEAVNGEPVFALQQSLQVTAPPAAAPEAPAAPAAAE